MRVHIAPRQFPQRFPAVHPTACSPSQSNFPNHPNSPTSPPNPCPFLFSISPPTQIPHPSQLPATTPQTHPISPTHNFPKPTPITLPPSAPSPSLRQTAAQPPFTIGFITSLPPNRRSAAPHRRFGEIHDAKPTRGWLVHARMPRLARGTCLARGLHRHEHRSHQ